jgi:predicted metal-dependent peptidase
MRQVSKLDKAKVAIGLDHPFFASILYKRKLVERKDIPTLAVSDRGTIYYNNDFLEGLTVPQIVWGLCHEVGHVIGQHATRRGSRDHKKWNYAGDAWINDTLDSCNVGQRIENTIDMKGSKDKTTEQIYAELPDNPDGNGSGNAGGSGTEYMDGDGLGDDIIQEGQPLTESEIKEIESQIKVELAEAAQVAKARGKLPGALAEFVADVINVKTPWHEILERYMVDQIKSDYSWARPNRRFIGSNLYMPSTGKTPSMGELVVQVDISGSVSKQEIEYYNGHLKRIVEQCKPTKVHVIYTDTQVQKHETFEGDDEFGINFYSGGGTHMPAGFEYLDEQGIEPDVFVCLTDGYTDFGEQQSYPTVWCISSNVEATHGESIHFEMEN